MFKPQTEAMMASLHRKRSQGAMIFASTKSSSTTCGTSCHAHTPLQSTEGHLMPTCCKSGVLRQTLKHVESTINKMELAPWHLERTEMFEKERVQFQKVGLVSPFCLNTPHNSPLSWHLPSSTEALAIPISEHVQTFCAAHEALHILAMSSRSVGQAAHLPCERAPCDRAREDPRGGCRCQTPRCASGSGPKPAAQKPLCLSRETGPAARTTPNPPPKKKGATAMIHICHPSGLKAPYCTYGV